MAVPAFGGTSQLAALAVLEDPFGVFTLEVSELVFESQFGDLLLNLLLGNLLNPRLEVRLKLADRIGQECVDVLFAGLSVGLQLLGQQRIDAVLGDNLALIVRVDQIQPVAIELGKFPDFLGRGLLRLRSLH